MSSARIFAVENRLARIAKQPGGRTFNEAVKSAERKVESVRERCMVALAGKAKELAAATEAAKAGPDGDLAEVYRLANAIYGLAGDFELKGLAEAALSLCDVVHAFRQTPPINWAAIDVHVDGIRLLNQKGEAVAEPVLEGLRRVQARFAAPD